MNNNHKNRGMLLEKLINITINYYVKNQIAFFHKNSLDIKFQSVQNNKSNSLSLNSSFIKSKSTVDYYGVYKGYYITFEAKSTDETNLPFSNIKEHQHKHLELIDKLGGKAFYLIFFKKFSEVYLVDVKDLDFYNKKSISRDEIKEVGKQIEIIFPGIIDFLSLI